MEVTAAERAPPGEAQQTERTNTTPSTHPPNPTCAASLLTTLIFRAPPKSWWASQLPHTTLLWFPSPSRTVHCPGPSLGHQALRPRGQILRRVSARPKLAVGRAEEGEPGVAERSWLHEDGEERRARYKANRVSLHLLQLVLLGHAVSEPSPREVPLRRGINARRKRGEPLKKLRSCCHSLAEHTGKAASPARI